MKNQKGITLIALVITIIVLLILAGVSIAMLTGDNGILTQAKNAKVTNIEGQVREEINLAVQAVKLYAESKSIETNSSWLASEKIGVAEDTKGKDTVIGQLKNDLTTEKGYSIEPGANKVTIKYAASDYKSATSNSNASISVEVSITANTFSIGNFNYTK